VRSPSELAEAFRSNGLKLTPQRKLLFQLLDGNQRHPTADELFAEASSRMPGISLRTVYQTLNDLVAMGELSSHSLGGGAVRFDPNTSEHHHLVCTRCRSAHDVAVSNLDALEFDGGDDFRIERTTVVFDGLCARCTGSPAGDGLTRNPADLP
jgi:Fe2+ or Zn2+ uptake regulation protein